MTAPSPAAPDTAEAVRTAALAGHYGRFGGRFVPEALMAALDELEAAFTEAADDPAFQDRLRTLQGDYAGRPTKLYLAERLTEHGGGARIYLKREDLAHTGSHKLCNVLGQGLLAQRMGKPRVIAETGAGQHGVATATVAAKLGLECVVYMGEEDCRRQRLNVIRMQMLGAEVVPVRSGTRTLKDAINEAMRDWVANVETTHYLIGSVMGPHLFPLLVREYVKVIGTEIRAQVLDREGRLPDAVVACVGGGSNAMGAFHPFIPDAQVRLVGVEAGGEGVEGDRHAATVSGGSEDHPRDAHDRAAGRVWAGPSHPLDLGGPGLPRRRARARVARRHRPRHLPGRNRHPGARGLPAAVAPRGHHPGAGAVPRGPADAAPRPRAGPRRDRGAQPVRARGQGRRRGRVAAAHRATR